MLPIPNPGANGWLIFGIAYLNPCQISLTVFICLKYLPLSGLIQWRLHTYDVHDTHVFKMIGIQRCFSIHMPIPSPLMVASFEQK